MPSPARRCGGNLVMPCPSNMIRPLVGRTAPAMALNSVVLPAPLGPMMARRCPRGTIRLTPSTARKASNATTRSVSVRIGSDTKNSQYTARGDHRVLFVDGRSSLLDSLKGARIGRLLHVGFRIVFPELRDVGIARHRHVPDFSVGAFHHLADVNVVDRVAVGVELDRLAERRTIELGLQNGVDES